MAASKAVVSGDSGSLPQYISVARPLAGFGEAYDASRPDASLDFDDGTSVPDIVRFKGLFGCLGLVQVFNGLDALRLFGGEASGTSPDPLGLCSNVRSHTGWEIPAREFPFIRLTP